MASEYVSITQGSVGVLEADDGSLGLFSGKIQTCRVSVFECEGATLLVHDTAQIRGQELCALIAQYGAVKSVKYAVGPCSHEHLHIPRFREIAKTLKFPLSAASEIRIPKEAYSVAYAKDIGLVAAEPRFFALRQDPNEATREAVNILNDWFTTPNSQSAPLDVQYQRGEFTPAPAPTLTALEMLKDLRDDKEHGLLGASALGYYGPVAGLKLPAELKQFLEESGLTEAYFRNLPGNLADKGKQYRQLADKFAQLPIFS